MPTSPFAMGDNLQEKSLEDYSFVSLKALWQNPGYTQWQRIYNGPYYGFGLSYGDFYNAKEIGKPASVYGILGIPIFRWAGFSSYSEFQFGMASNWRFYNPETNPKNIAVGGSLTIHLDLALKMYYAINKHLEIGSGISFIHFSNGGFERPNRGVNIYSPTLDLRYRFRESPNYKNIPKANKEPKYHKLMIMLGYGDYQLVEHELDTNYFAFGGLSLLYLNQLSNAFQLGLGSDINYWWGLNANQDGTPGKYSFENITVGIILEPEFVIDRLTLVGGVGIYAIHRNYGNFKQTYQRLGVRYDIYKDLAFGVNVRAINFMLAEVLEFNLSYNLKWEK
jgi:hypothetical protein